MSSTKCIRPPLILLQDGEYSFTDAVFRLPKVIQPTENCWVRWDRNSWELVPDGEKGMYVKLEGEHPDIATVKPEDVRYLLQGTHEPAYHVGPDLMVTVYKRTELSIQERPLRQPVRSRVAAASPTVMSAPVRQLESPEQRAERERLGREEAERIRAARREAARQKAENDKILSIETAAAAREQRIRENEVTKRHYEERLRKIEARKQTEVAQRPSFEEEVERTKQTLNRLQNEKDRLLAEQSAETDRWAQISRERRSSQSIVPKQDVRVREIMHAASGYFETQPRALNAEQREKIARALQKTREGWLTKHDPTHPDFIGQRRRRVSLSPNGDQSLPPTDLMRVSPQNVSALNHTDILMEGIILGVNPMLFPTSKLDETVRAARSSRNTALQMSYNHTSSILQLICFAAIIAALSSVFVFGITAMALVRPRARLDSAITNVQLPQATDARDFAAAEGSLALANEFALELDEAFNMQPKTWEMTDAEAVRVVQETWCPALQNVLWGLSSVEGALQDEENSFYMMLAKLCKEVQDGHVSEAQASDYTRNIQSGINCMLFNQYEGRFDVSEQCPAAPLVNSAVAVSNSMLGVSRAAGIDLKSAATNLGAILLTGAAGLLFSALTGGSGPPLEFIQFGRRRNKNGKISMKKNGSRHARR